MRLVHTIYLHFLRTSIEISFKNATHDNDIILALEMQEC